MEQAKKLRMEAIEMIKGSMGNFIFPHQFWLDVENALDIYVQQIRSEEQAKTRGTAIEFAETVVIDPFGDSVPKSIIGEFFDEWFTNKAQQK